MLSKQIKKSLVETKERKEKLLIEQLLVKNRLSIIIENVKTIDNFNNLPKGKKLKLSVNILKELSYLEKSGFLLKESFDSALSSIFGGASGSISQSMVEPFVNNLVGNLFKDGPMKGFLISYLNSKPSDVIQAFNNCKLMTKLVTKGVVEGMIITTQKIHEFNGVGYDSIKDSLGDVFRTLEFMKRIEYGLEGDICELFEKYTNNTKSIVDKLKSSITTT